MTLDNKNILTYGVGVALSVVVTVFGSPTTGLIVFFGTSLFAQILASERRAKRRHEVLEGQLATAKAEFASKVGLADYYHFVEGGGCPLFKLAAGEAYQKTQSDLANLKKGELILHSLDDAFHYVEFLFRDFPAITKIKAISSGEFDEWKEHESWWCKRYLDIHKAAFDRGAEIERIFVVKSKQQERSVRDVFQRNIDYNVQVKIALDSRIRPGDRQASNCLLFYDIHNEPLYALVAHHDQEGNFQRAVIYGANNQNVRLTADMYNRIEGVARLFGVQMAA